MVEATTGRKRFYILLAVGLAVIIAIAFIAISKKAPEVAVVSATRGDLSETISSNGKVEPISPEIAHAEFATFVQKVTATEGQTVHRGELILTLDGGDVESQLQQARAELLAGKTDLANANNGGPPDEVAQIHGSLQQQQLEVENLQRTEKNLEQLVAKQAATRDELAQSKSSLAGAEARLRSLEQREAALAKRAGTDAQSAQLRVDQARQQVQSLEEKVRSARVVADADGTLYSLPVRPGDFVKVGDVLAEMADLKHVRVRAFVDEPDLGWLQPMQEVQVNWDAKPGKVWTGDTEQVPKQVVPHGTRSVGEVLCSIDNAQLELIPNINVQVRILVRNRPGVTLLPRAAVRESNGRHYVFAVRDDRIHRQDITVGVASASQYEVASGLSVGDRVALSGDEDLRDGMKIHPTEAH